MSGRPAPRTHNLGDLTINESSNSEVSWGYSRTALFVHFSSDRLRVLRKFFDEEVKIIRQLILEQMHCMHDEVFENSSKAKSSGFM